MNQDEFVYMFKKCLDNGIIKFKGGINSYGYNGVRFLEISLVITNNGKKYEVEICDVEVS